jgi:hypothetical protein
MSDQTTKFDHHVKVIKDGNSRLSISLDYETDQGEVFSVILFVPDKGKPEHEHIRLSRDEAFDLFMWLGEFLERKWTK